MLRRSTASIGHPQRAMRCTAWLVLAMASVPGARAQGILASLPAPNGVENYGAAVARMGDIDGDGFDELAISGVAANDVLQVRLTSVATGVNLATVTLPFGSVVVRSLANVGDVDADGFPDGAVSSGSLLRVFSGLNGKTLVSWSEPSMPGFGEHVEGAGDVDGDGFADIVITASAFPPTPGAEDQVFVRSPHTGLDLLHWVDLELTVFGSSIDGGHDLDGDGIPDVLIGVDQGFATLAGRVEARSGATGDLLWQLQASPSDGTGTLVEGIGEMDGSGRAAVAIGNASYKVAGTTVGRITLHAGLDGSLVDDLVGGGQLGLVGLDFSAASDMDGDGAQDLAHISGGAASSLLSTLSGRTAGILRIVGFVEPGSWSALTSRQVAAAEDYDLDGTPELHVGRNRLDDDGVVHRITFAPPIVKEVDPPVVTNWPSDDEHVHLHGSSFSFVERASVGGHELTPGNGLEIVGDGTIVLQVPKPLPLGTYDIILRSADRRSLAQPLAYGGSEPPQLSGSWFGTTHLPVSYDIGAKPTARGLLLVSAWPDVTLAPGFPVLAAPVLFFPGQVDEFGLGAIQVSFPPQAAGLTVWLQYVTIDGAVLSGASDVLSVWVVV